MDLELVQTVLLVVHLILALSLIGIVLLQRSEGGGLGIGGGGGAATGRAAPTALGKMTWALAIAFICTSMGLTIIAAENSAGTSVVDRLQDVPSPAATQDTPSLGEGEGLLPPSATTDGTVPLLPDAN